MNVFDSGAFAKQLFSTKIRKMDSNYQMIALVSALVTKPYNTVLNSMNFQILVIRITVRHSYFLNEKEFGKEK